MENVKSVPENLAVCLCIVPEFLIGCYYSVHFPCLSHFSVTELEFTEEI